MRDEIAYSIVAVIEEVREHPLRCESSLSVERLILPRVVVSKDVRILKLRELLYRSFLRFSPVSSGYLHVRGLIFEKFLSI